ncbi:MAG: prepilin-type N-terminal cleavage/methylation domain-containing protein [Candidatus Gracilibacteria bacterium]|nr:prepilin-type N-terminal cleavage/methylation domain-containing protein [Candidatus Gracilibacteria bacterium]MDD4530956.1 prepilin-type N-terminal cleavage/methylation domain-containing protein [Candidatus Gracilibacteria bacterium]
MFNQNTKFNKFKPPPGFTLIELIVVITILAILSTIAFISFQDYSKNARDSSRVSDIAIIMKLLEMYKVDNSYYPLPDSHKIVTYDNDAVWYQGTVGDTMVKVLYNSLSKKPLDPKNKTEYIYSITSSKREYELLAVTELLTSLDNSKDDFQFSINNPLIDTAYASTTSLYKTKVSGTYNQIYVKTSKYYIPLPSILTSESLGSTGFVLDNTKIKSMVINGGANMPNVGIPDITNSTGSLNINLSVYTGSITPASTETDKRSFIEAIKLAYTGSSLTSNTIYSNILQASSTGAIVTLANSLVSLNSGWSR